MPLPTVSCFRQMDIIDQLSAIYQAILEIQSGGNFSPDQILGLQAWYKDEGIIDDGSAVSAWNDSSGNANHLTTGIGSGPGIGDLNGHKTVSFLTDDGVSGTPVAMVAPLLSGSAATIFVVMNKSNDFPESGGWITDFGFSNHHPLATTQIRDGTFSNAQKNCNNQVVPIPDNWRIFSIRSQDSDYRMELDGEPQFNTATNTYSSGDIFLLGAGAVDGSLVTNYALKGQIAEVIVYNAFLTDNQRDAVLNYLRNRFSL